MVAVERRGANWGPGQRPAPARDLGRQGFAGAHSALTTVNPEWHPSQAAPTERIEADIARAKTTRDARTMVANMVAERLALCGISASSAGGAKRRGAGGPSEPAATGTAKRAAGS